VDLNAPANEEDFVEIRLVTRTTGKINNGQSCAVCHTTQLQVGEFSHFSKPRTNFTEKNFFFRKGTNYPIYLTELAQNVPPATGNNNSPGSSHAYTAAILPATNQPPAFVVQDPQARLGTNKLYTSLPPDPSVAIGSLIVPKIQVTFTNLPGNVALDANPNAGGGMRVYPDALNPSDFLVRNRVRVKVKTIPALPGQQVRLKSFDVDDPFVLLRHSPAETDPGDAGGEKGNDNLGTSSEGQLAATLLTLDGQGEAITEYAVSFQPGNNFRVAVVLDAPAAQAHLDQLQVTDANAPLYVTAGTNAVSGFVGGISPMLTVWRKLHLEFDTMGIPPASGSEALSFAGSIVNVTPNKPTQGHSIVRVRHTLGAGSADRFQDGKVEIAGFGAHVISNSHTAIVGAEFMTTLRIIGVPGAVSSGTAATLYDDDNHYLSNDPLFPSLLTLQSPPVPALDHVGPCLATNAARFAAAYISLINANTQGFSTGTAIPFKRQSTMGPFDVGNQELKGKDRPEFWAFTVVFGFEGGAYEDFDPNSEPGTLGITQKSVGGLLHSFSVIYLESNRDGAFFNAIPSNFTTPVFIPGLVRDYLEQIYSTVGHEIAHAPGGQRESVDHKEEGLMNGGLNRSREAFTPKTVLRLRRTAQWTR